MKEIDIEAENKAIAQEYKELLHIFDTCIVFANDTTEIVVQLVNNKYIFI